MPRPHLLEFRRRAVDLARLREKPVAQIEADLGISDSCLGSFMVQADLDAGRRADWLTTAERDRLDTSLDPERGHVRPDDLEIDVRTPCPGLPSRDMTRPHGSLLWADLAAVRC